MRSRARVTWSSCAAVITSVSATRVFLFAALVLRGAPIDKPMGLFFLAGNVAVVPIAVLLAGFVTIVAKPSDPTTRFLRAFAVGYPLVVVLLLLWAFADAR